MDGGGGGGGGDAPTRPISELREIADRSVQRDRDESGIDRFLDEQLRDLNARDAATIRERLDEILAVLDAGIEGTDELLFGGSVAKHTYCDGLSDVDALLLFREDIAGGQSPAELRALVADALAVGLGQDAESVTAGTLAVTIHYRDGREVQVLPAVRRGEAFEIADATGATWTRIRPRAFAEKLSAVNAAKSGIVVPAVKIAKAFIAAYPDDRRLSGYHVESLAIEAFESYAGPNRLNAAVRHFFERAAERVLSPITDATGQSRHIDDALGARNSVERRACADSLARTARILREARTAEDWAAELT